MKKGQIAVQLLEAREDIKIKEAHIGNLQRQVAERDLHIGRLDGGGHALTYEKELVKLRDYLWGSSDVRAQLTTVVDSAIARLRGPGGGNVTRSA